MATEVDQVVVNSKLAVLIDADNASPNVADALLAEVAKYGTSFVKRAYGDWTGTNLKGWKEQLLRKSIQPFQQFAYTQGKNATDSAMIIDAMDLLYTNRFDGFCLVSSDSDFTRLATRIRESGLVVYGFGERKTPKPFVVACDKFIYFENLNITPPDDPAPPATPTAGPQVSSANVLTVTHRRAPSTTSGPGSTIDAKLEQQLRDAVEASSDEEGWANLAKVGALITKQRPDFDPRTYGHLKFSEVVIATNAFDIVKRTPAEGKAIVMYARDKKRTPAGSAAAAAAS
ncbi:NYN domain-containing protein [Parachaetomium inaequale]|uniref:NYN domain-containing protein n=1 Tax=Parachaetomium inaequale TaxID=2588326 RepID=A0AAN6P543_9PEZI|nr:NYN domain-containing protein [Parachaetomium inaequale]